MMDLQKVMQVLYEPRYRNDIAEYDAWCDEKGWIIWLCLRNKITLSEEINSAEYPRSLAKKLRRATKVFPQQTYFAIREWNTGISLNTNWFDRKPYDAYTNVYCDFGGFDHLVYRAHNDNNPRLLVDTLVAYNKYINPCDEAKIEDFFEQYNAYKKWCKRKWEIQTGDPFSPTVLKRFRRAKSAERWAKSHTTYDNDFGIMESDKVIWVPHKFLKRGKARKK